MSNLPAALAAQAPILDQVIDYAANKIPPKEQTLFAKFLGLYYANSAAQDVSTKPISTLFAIAYSHWELMKIRKPGEIKLNVFNPAKNGKDSWPSTHTVIQITLEDMPFLVDSVRMEINKLGFTAHLMIYSGGIQVLRNEANEITSVESYQGGYLNSDSIEAPIYIEIDRQTDPDVLEDIKQSLLDVLGDVRVAVDDWPLMKSKMQQAVDELKADNMTQEPAEVEEACAFLEWLLNNHFTFLGYRSYEVVGKGEAVASRLVSHSGLGVLRDETNSKMLRQYVDLPKQAREAALSKDILIISKTNTISTVHRPAYTDYIGVKRFNQKGELIGEHRFIGLYTSTAYSSNPQHIPMLRRKVTQILRKSGLRPSSHAGKDLMHILVTLPRDDLFQASVDELYEMAMGILHLQERRQVRLFIRKDAYRRFVSCLVYVPRENFNTGVVLRMQDLLMQAFHGLDASYTTYFSESILTRIHYVIRIDPKKPINVNLSDLQEKLVAIGESWEDGFRQQVLEFYGEERGLILFNRYRTAFPVGYRESFSPRQAVSDIEYIEKLNPENILEMNFYRAIGEPQRSMRFKVFCLQEAIPLSDALPLLENLGLRVISEEPYRVVMPDHKQIWINVFSMSYVREPNFVVEDIRDSFQEAFGKIWRGYVDNDLFNRLVLEANLSWREVNVLRAYTKYLKQIGFTFSEQYIANTLINNAKITQMLMDLFICYFDPTQVDAKTKERAVKIIEKIQAALDDVKVLDEDRILRRYLSVFRATLRTNYFQVDEFGNFKNYLSFKLDPQKIPKIPLPIPRYEIFVCSPRFEGVHLRMAKVARGGIRWSDRREDFRTEILGLMKAQQVKNSVIVPAGAKGGFVPKFLPIEQGREAVMQEGIHCYQDFIRGMLDLVDNLKSGIIVPAENTVCYDDPDPYLVVAADKGTATFSDIANRISLERGYWMGDAFASGGSSGYDHKKMGITARGAWVSARYHFQALSKNVDEAEITVVGIGDMSGDVFGNGLLMSSHVKLVAAFNHEHIFLDPNPIPEKSYEERSRLFNLPRSSWSDYNADLISKGGGVYSRQLKTIAISPEVKALLGLQRDAMEPNQLIRAILKAPVDLIWNGGIGTYVKSSAETNSEVGDRNNDALRINGKELRAKVVCEGGNLGLTQLGRIEYELQGGLINTDFIDNSAGVDCSDHEVNIKILLNDIVAEGEMTLLERDELLASMTEEVAELVLKDNSVQNKVISFATYSLPDYLELFIRYLNSLEQSGKIDQKLEFLPDSKTLAERRAALGKSFTRPELSILLAYTKNIYKEEIKKSNLVQDDYLMRYVKRAFPKPLRERFPEKLRTHYLSSDILATQLCNALVADMGITFVYQLQEETSLPFPDIVRAYVAASKIFGMSSLLAEIDALDYQITKEVQNELTFQVLKVIRRATRWLLRNRPNLDIEKTIEHFSEYVRIIYIRLPKLLLGADKEMVAQKKAELLNLNVPEETATKIASALPMCHALNIIEAATELNVEVFRVAKIYFILLDRLNLLWFRDQINTYPIYSHWSVLARAAFKGDLDWIQRALVIGVLLEAHAKSIPGKVNAWLMRHDDLIKRWKDLLTDMHGVEKSDFAILFVAVRELVGMTAKK